MRPSEVHGPGSCAAHPTPPRRRAITTMKTVSLRAAITCQLLVLTVMASSGSIPTG